MPEWTAEERVDEERAVQLIAEQFPALPARSLRLLSEGWDYAVFVVDEIWAFRFPRRAVGVPGTELELAVLPRIAPHLPVPVPVPELVGRPTASFPWPFYGAPFLAGVELGDAALGDDERVELARPLARALRRLHAPGVLAAVGDALPEDPMGRGDPRIRAPKTREQLAAIEALWPQPPAVDELLERALALPPPEPAVVCHGDLHFRQVLVDRGAVTGLIDWVDVCRGDPGIDLQLAVSYLPPRGLELFLEEYGSVSEDSLLRARVLALSLNAALARYGHEEGQERIRDEALAGLRRTVVD